MGRAFDAFDEEAAPSAGRRREAQDFGGALTGGRGAFSSAAGGSAISTFGDGGGIEDGLLASGEAAAIESEVLVDKGEDGMGVSGAVELADVVSVSPEECTAARSGEGSWAGSCGAGT